MWPRDLSDRAFYMVLSILFTIYVVRYVLYPHK